MNICRGGEVEIAAACCGLHLSVLYSHLHQQLCCLSQLDAVVIAHPSLDPLLLVHPVHRFVADSSLQLLALAVLLLSEIETFRHRLRFQLQFYWHVQFLIAPTREVKLSFAPVCPAIRTVDPSPACGFVL